MLQLKPAVLLLASALAVAACRSTSSQVRDSSGLQNDAAAAAHFGLPPPTVGSLQASDGMRLSYEAFVQPDAKDAVVMISGFTESYLLYDELIADFYHRGWSVYIMDNRGMGKSGRAPELHNPQVVYVNSINDFVSDEEQLINTVVRPATPGRLLLFAHSTGGLIGANLLARHPSWFARAVLNCPLMGAKLPTGLTQVMANAIIAKGIADHKEYEYIPNVQDADVANYTFATNITTHDPRRFEIGRQVLLAHPEIVQGGPSYAFDRAVFETTAAVPTFAPKVTTPVLLVQAGQDEFVRPEPEELFCRLASNCTMRFEPNARHEAFRETDDIRAPLVAAYISHLEKNP